LKKPLKIVLGLGAVGLAAIQFDAVADALPKIHEKHLRRPPDRTVDPAGTLAAVASPPEDVKALLDAACYDCHSNATRWPWYSYVAPFKWFVIEHVNDGRKHVDFSEFGAELAEDQGHILRECAEVVEEGAMPLSGYPALHSDARLDDAERKKLVDWFRAEAGRRDPSGGKKSK
jgi:hypothetical protein